MHPHSQPYFVDSSHLAVSQLTLIREEIIGGANMIIIYMLSVRERKMSSLELQPHGTDSILLTVKIQQQQHTIYSAIKGMF